MVDLIILLPFALLLGAMAIVPVIAPKWWTKHYAKIALGLGAITALYYFGKSEVASLGHAAHEYAGFLTLIGALFVVAGGIQIEVPGRGTPAKNVFFLLAGALAANVLGTTGAAMLLIRPWLRFNRARLAAHHTVFFIFLVANVGGCLTPIGDPPLFLGFLQGIPFGWVAQKCWPMWSGAVGALLAIFYVLDKIHFLSAKNATDVPTETQKWHVSGLVNLFFLAVILGAIFVEQPFFLREALMLAAAAGSYFTTRKLIHAANRFDFHPIQEVAILFAGIFLTMLPALDWLKAHAGALLGKNPSPSVFFWGTGTLSSVLDNAPTYLGFLSVLTGSSGAADIHQMLDSHSLNLIAISVGAVFFGAATYIGNGPNFMVKAISEQTGAPTPSFFGFILKFSLPCLLPVLIMVWLVFFRG